MKKFYKYMVLMLLLAVGFFYGCSKSADMQTTPESENFTTLSSTNDNGYFFNNSSYCYKYIELVYEKDGTEQSDDKEIERSVNKELSDNGILLTDKTTFVVSLIENINKEVILFDNDSVKSAYINKLTVLENLIKKDKIQAALNKIQNDLIPSSERWLSGDSVNIAGGFLELTNFVVSANDAFPISVFLSSGSGDCDGRWVWTLIAGWVCWKAWKIKGTITLGLKKIVSATLEIELSGTP